MIQDVSKHYISKLITIRLIFGFAIMALIPITIYTRLGVGLALYIAIVLYILLVSALIYTQPYLMRLKPLITLTSEGFYAPAPYLFIPWSAVCDCRTVQFSTQHLLMIQIDATFFNRYQLTSFQRKRKAWLDNQFKASNDYYIYISISNLDIKPIEILNQFSQYVATNQSNKLVV